MPQWSAGQSGAGNWGGSVFSVFKSSKHPKEATQFDIWLNTNTQSLEDLIKGNSIYPAYQSEVDAPILNQPQPFFGNQNIYSVFKQAITQVNTNFIWGPTMDQVYSDIDDDFANAVNGKGILTDALNAAQQSTVSFMKKQGFSVST